MDPRPCLSALTLAAALTGCTVVGKPQTAAPVAPPAQETSGRSTPWQETYGGRVVLQGQKLSLLLLLELNGPGDARVHAVLHIDEIGLVAEGDGTRHDGALDLKLAYLGNCPGKLVLTAEPAAGEGALAGTLQATDCTGKEEGAVRLLRRSPTGLW